MNSRAGKLDKMHWLHLGRALLLRRALHPKTGPFLQSSKSLHCCSCGTIDKGWKRAGGWKRTQTDNRYDVPHIRLSKLYFSRTAASSIWFFGSKEPPAIPPDFQAPDVSLSTGPVDPATVADVTAAADTAASASVVVDAAGSSGFADTVVASGIVDPPFVEMGLATSWYPNHFVHQLLEWVHLSSDLPWWATIILGTMTIRVMTLPLYVYTRKYLIKQNNHREELQTLMTKYTDAKNEDNYLKRVVAQQKLTKFYKDTGTGPVKGMLVNLSMMSIFMTCIIAVRQMCAVPVPSLTDGGALWFTNLAAPDPYYALPILTGTVMALTLHTSLKGGTLQTGSKYAGLIRKLIFLPIVGMPLVFGYSNCGIHIYWLTTSIISLGVQSLLRVPELREALKFPEPVQRDAKPQGMKQTLKEWKRKNDEKVRLRMARKAIVSERKKRIKERKKELKKQPPVTYTIGVGARPVRREVVDFEKEWRPPRPKSFGLY